MAARYNPLYFQLFPVKPGKGEIRKAAFIEAAIRLIAKKGGESLSFESLARMLKVRRSHLTYYFESVDELLLMAVKLVTATVQQLIVLRMHKAKTPQERLKALIDANGDWFENYPEQTPVMLYFNFKCHQAPVFRDLNDSILKAGHARLTAIFTEWPHDKSTKVKMDAQVIQNLIAAEMMIYGTSGKTPSGQKFREEVWPRVLNTSQRLGYQA